MSSSIKMIAYLLGMAIVIFGTSQAYAGSSTNAASNAAGGGVTLTDSGNVTVTSVDLQLAKYVFDASGNCLASSPADTDCTNSTSTSVPKGATVQFLIIVRNDTNIQLSDARFTDVLDETGPDLFTYTTSSMKTDSAQANNATLANIYTAANTGTGLSDGSDADIASKSGATISVGGAGNGTLNIPALKTFAFIFSATKD